MAVDQSEVPEEIAIRRACTDSDVASFRELVLEYYEFLNEDISFQDFEAEMAGLPGHFAPPGGVILLASDQGLDAGCVALRPALKEAVSSSTCVMKRLYVRPQHQGRSIGRLLVEEAVSTAKELGYTGMVFDTLERLSSANKLYHKLGCKVLSEPFYHNPLPGTVYWHMQL